MSTSGIDSILTRVERLSTDDKKLLIKRVIDLLDERKQELDAQSNRRRSAGMRGTRKRSVLGRSIAAYAEHHGGGAEQVDMDPVLEAASVEFLLSDAENDEAR